RHLYSKNFGLAGALSVLLLVITAILSLIVFRVMDFKSETRSDIWGMRKMGIELHFAGPKTLLPRFLSEEPGIVIHDRIEDAIKDADAIEVLRIQLERQKAGLFPSNREYARIFGINNERLALAKDDVLILHPGPMNKGLEISPYVAYGNNSAIQEQVQNGVAVRMALLTLVLTGGKLA
ncbi:MAG: hypothetical protein SPL45_09745, partial [Schwartzia succinivorans]|nr:hypothetical protein [Schwartzia succinivorans]